MVNLNISIAVLSSQPIVKHVEDYQHLARNTAEGVFTNIIDRSHCDQLLAKFGRNLEIYSCEAMPMITELF